MNPTSFRSPCPQSTCCPTPARNSAPSSTHCPSPCCPGTSLLRSFAPFQTPSPRNPTPNALYPPPRGVFGFVKRVQHKGNQMSCAAKFIPLRSRTRVQAYRERDILAGLSHPLVTALLDQFETQKTLILILELYPVSPQGCKVVGGGGCAPDTQGSGGLRGVCGFGDPSPACLMGAAGNAGVSMLCD